MDRRLLLSASLPINLLCTRSQKPHIALGTMTIIYLLTPEHKRQNNKTVTQ